MLQVLRQTVSLRKFLLFAGETVLLTLVVAAMMSAHLWGDPTRLVRQAIAIPGFTVEEAILRCFFSSFLIAVIGQAAISFNELYEFRVSASRYERFSRIVSSCGLAAILTVSAIALTRLWGLDYLLDFPGLTLSRTVQTLVFSLILGFAALYLWRLLFHSLLQRLSWRERVLLLSSANSSPSLLEALAADSQGDYELIGLVDAEDLRPETDPATGSSDPLGGAIRFSSSSALPALHPRRGPSPLSGWPRLRTPDPASGPRLANLPRHRPHPGEPLLEMVRRLDVGHLLVSLEDRRGVLPTGDLLACRLAGVTVEEGESLYERATGRIAVEALRPSYLIFNSGFSKSPLSELVKRIFDLVAATILLLLLWPMMLLTALAVRLDSKGPVLFRQERIGRYGQPFVLNKFRSMRVDAEKATGPVWAQKDDPRVTRVGRFLRKTRLDEFPQLFNVLAGSMSLVGPRPERRVFIDDLMKQIPYYDQRHTVQPGVTGWAQINYPYGNTVEDALQKLQYDLFYIKYRSLFLDMSILVQTIKTVVLRRGT